MGLGEEEIPELPRGVYPRFSKYRPTYYSKIMVNKKMHWLGTFKSVGLAKLAYHRAKVRKLNGINPVSKRGEEQYVDTQEI